MDLVFDAENGISFTVEVGYFDTIQEIKQKVTKYHGIPVQEQTLKFDGKTLPDDLNIHTSDILDGSHLQLITPTTAATTDRQQSPQTATIKAVKTEDNTPSPSSCSSSHKMIKLHLKPFGISIEADPSDPVLKIKEKMHESEGIPISRMVVHANGIELQDHKSLHECQLVDGSELELTLKPPTPPTPPTPPPAMITHAPPLSGLNMGLLGKKMKVYVMSKCGEKISLEVNGSSNVGELRKELEKVRNQGVGFRIPEEGYFFIYKQNVMEEDHSFRWHRVGHGDTIEIFNGCVTGGS